MEYPNKHILISRIDLYVAYGRIRIHPKKAVTEMSIIENIAYLETRLIFGVAAGPSVFSTESKAIFDFITYLLTDETWKTIFIHALD